MSDVNTHILNAIKTWVWSGFYSESDVQQMIGDSLDKGADEAQLRASVAPEFASKAATEPTWPETTDCDRLDQAFAELNERGIIALQNAGYTMSDGRYEVGLVLRTRGRKGVNGYCFYHGQDLERAVTGGGLWLAFGDFDNDRDSKIEIGRSVRRILEQLGFSIDWSNDAETRIYIPEFDWKRRAAQ
jgi:hypothetical protein